MKVLVLNSIVLCDCPRERLYIIYGNAELGAEKAVEWIATVVKDLLVVHTYTHTHSYIHTYIHAYAHTHTHIHKYIHTHLPTYLHT